MAPVELERSLEFAQQLFGGTGAVTVLAQPLDDLLLALDVGLALTNVPQSLLDNAFTHLPETRGRPDRVQAGRRGFGTQPRFRRSGATLHTPLERPEAMRSILLYAIGVPIPIILLLAFCTHHF